MKDIGEFSIVQTYTHDFVAKSNGETFRVFVSPMQPERSATPVSVVYSTDANVQYGTFVETARMMILAGEIEPLILVGIGYPVDQLKDFASRRNFDLSPSPDPDFVPRATIGASSPPARFGGARAFLDFIEHELSPALEAEYNASPDDRGICGHSFGGLFAAYALLQPKPAFQRYIIGSPSLWWNRRELFASEIERFESGEGLRGRVFISAGELEESPLSPASLPRRMVSNAIEFAGALAVRGYPGLSVRTHVFPGESHVSVIGPTYARGLRVLYGTSPA